MELTDGLQNYTYRLDVKFPNGTIQHVMCNITDHTCNLNALTPARPYALGLKACFMPLADKTVCSPVNKTLVIGTIPEGSYPFLLFIKYPFSSEHTKLF